MSPYKKLYHISDYTFYFITEQNIVTLYQSLSFDLIKLLPKMNKELNKLFYHSVCSF